jgi:hypothetical protein
MPYQQSESVTITLAGTHNMWAGILEKRKLKLFNLLHTSIQKSIDYTETQLTSPHKRLAVCVFNCSNPNLLYGYDFSHRLNRSHDFTNSAVIKEAKMLRLLDAMSKVGSDLSGLTAKRLKNIRAGMNFVSRTTQTASTAPFEPQFSGGIFVATYLIEDRVFGWNKSQEFRSGSQ